MAAGSLGHLRHTADFWKKAVAFGWGMDRERVLLVPRESGRPADWSNHDVPLDLSLSLDQDWVAKVTRMTKCAQIVVLISLPLGWWSKKAQSYLTLVQDCVILNFRLLFRCWGRMVQILL